MSAPRTVLRTRVAYLIYHVGLGGGELLLANHLAHADREAFDPLVVCIGEGPLPERLRNLGIPVFTIPMDRKIDILGRIWIPGPAPVWQLVALLRRERASLIHSYTLDTRNYANAASVLTGIPVIHTCQDTWLGRDFGAVQWWIMNHVAARIIAVSETARQALRTGTKLDADRVAVIPAGIDLTRFSGQNNRAAVRAEFLLSAETPLIGFIGRMDAAIKGFDTFAEATANVFGKLPSARAIVVGGAALPGDNANEVTELFRRYDLKDRIVLTGHRDDVPRLLAAMDVVVSASPRECYPLVLMEAAAAGRPVVATRSGGGEEIVLDGETGVLVPIRDPGAMAEALLAVLRDQRKANAMGQAARQRAAARFDIKQMVRLVEAEYRRVANPRPPDTAWTAALD